MNCFKHFSVIALLLPTLAFAGGNNATIIKSIPVSQKFTSMEQNCQEVTVHNTGNNLLGNLVGVAIGAAVGHQFTTGSRGVNRAIGGLIGYQTANEYQNMAKTVTQCTPQPVTRTSIIGYDVTYQYKGKLYTQRMDYDPGVGSVVQVRLSIN